MIDLPELTPDISLIATPPEWLSTFVPRRGLRNGHLQTLIGNYMRRPVFRLESLAEIVEVDPEDGSRILCHTSLQPEAVRSACLTVVLIHGLEGSSNSQYIRGLAARAWNAGAT